MRRLLILATTIIIMTMPAWAVGSVNQSLAQIPGSTNYVYTENWVGDAATGSVPATVMLGTAPIQGYRVVSVEVAPGSPAPTNGYSITLTDFSGADIFGGSGANQSSTTPTILASIPTTPPLYGSLTVNITGNVVASAQGRLMVYFAPVSQVMGNTPAGANLTASNLFTGSNTFSGTSTFTGLLLCKNMENVQCVDSTLSRGGSDIGAELNLAYAALPPAGGVIWLFPNSTGTNYTYSTPIVFATSVKPVRLECYAASTPTPTSNGGCVLNYTPTTATAAITLDYGFNGSGSGIEQNHGIQNVTFINNGCFTAGGCGSSASGVKIGNTNGGAGQATFRMRIIGFGIGFDNTIGPSVSWGYSFQHSSFVDNVTGMNLGAGIEAMSCMGCQFVSNSQHFVATGGDNYFYGTSFDGHTSTTGGINLNWNGRSIPAFAEFTSCHFEKNNGNTNDNHYIIGNGNYKIIGGFLEIDANSGNQDFYFNGGGAFITILGMELSTAGQTVTQIISTSGAPRGRVEIIFFNHASKPTICGVGNCSGITDSSYLGDLSNGASVQTLSASAFAPNTAGATDVGTTLLPWGNLWLGTAATNNFKFAPATTGAARTITIPDPGANDTLPFLAATQTFTNKTLTSPIITTSLTQPETTAPSASASNDVCYADSTAHGLKCSYNNGTFFNLPLTGTNNVWSGAQSFNSGTLQPSAAGGTDLGATALPFGNAWLGTAGTNNFKIQPAATTGARVITITDPVSPTTVGLPLTIANGTATMTTALIASQACGTVVTVAGTGIATTDSIYWNDNAQPAAATNGVLTIKAWPTSGNVNFFYCNPTAAGVTPAAATLNWRVAR